MATYGDTVTIPSITDAHTGEPIRFKAHDLRDIENAHGMYEDVSALLPVDADGNRLSSGLSIKVGRAYRTVSDLGRMYARYTPHGIQWAAWSSDFTDAMNAAVSNDVRAIAWELPRYTLEEMRAALIRAAEAWGASVGSFARHNYRLLAPPVCRRASRQRRRSSLPQSRRIEHNACRA